MIVFRFVALLLILAAASRPSSLSDKGMGLDPNGRPSGAAAGDRGAGLDPNG
jgi:hypothetical protein